MKTNQDNENAVPEKSSPRWTRRRFAFWVGLGIFSLGERLNAQGFDHLAAATMKLAGPSNKQEDDRPEHWSVEENSDWRWFCRETMVDGKWKRSGITTPISKHTGRRYSGRTGYLDDSLVPENIRKSVEANSAVVIDETVAVEYDPDGPEPGQPTEDRRARHGRPPSEWLRSLEAEELRIWLKTIRVPETGVSGMTFWTHLTRDHSFDPEKIEGLDEFEQERLHSAAHYGY